MLSPEIKKAKIVPAKVTDQRSINTIPPWPVFSSILKGFLYLYDLFLVLTNFPIPGEGRGSHSYLLTAANSCRHSFLPVEVSFWLIRAAIPKCGSKQIQDFDIHDALDKAYNSPVLSKKKTRKKNKKKPKRRISLQEFCKGNEDTHEADLTKASPDPIGDGLDLLPLLSGLYQLSDWLFIGHRDNSQSVAQVSTWIQKLQQNSTALNCFPLIQPNPLTGQLGKTKSGKSSYRCDNAVQSFRFAVAEFDNLTKDDQYIFWAAAIGRGFPVAALIDSGGKSIHGWLTINCDSREEWEAQVEKYLFPEILVPLGCDPMCRNESRMSRLPGHFREETGCYQRLIYLNPQVVQR